jgi:hypothetical protein
LVQIGSSEIGYAGQRVIEISDVKAKGMGLAGLISALKPAYAAKPELVPVELRHYLSGEPNPDSWYSLADYIALMKILAATIDPVKAKGDVYRAFGVIAAQRDVFDAAPNVPVEQRPKVSGKLQGALKGVTGLASLIRRALHLRERYYSRGYYTVKRTGERKVEVTLEDFPVCAELCAVSTGYLTHVLRTAKVGIWVERASCKAQGHPDCRWELRFGDDADVSDLAVYE